MHSECGDTPHEVPTIGPYLLAEATQYKYRTGSANNGDHHHLRRLRAHIKHVDLGRGQIVLLLWHMKNHVRKIFPDNYGEDHME